MKLPTRLSFLLRYLSTLRTSACELFKMTNSQVFCWYNNKLVIWKYKYASGRLDGGKNMPQYCPKCGTQLLIGAKFCSRCGLALDIHSAIQIEAAREKTDTIMDVLLQDQEFKVLLTKKLKEYDLLN